MIRKVRAAFDRFRGSGEAAVTVPPMDGAFRPNGIIEEAEALLTFESPDNLAWNGRRVLFSSGKVLLALCGDKQGAVAERVEVFSSTISCVGALNDGSLAVGLSEGGIEIRHGTHDGLVLSSLNGTEIICPTALRFADANTLFACLGSAVHRPEAWKADLMKGRAAGSAWRIDLQTGRAECLAAGLAFPYGMMITEEKSVVVAESWRHRLIEIDAKGTVKVLLEDLPGYPARLESATGNGAWLCVFAPRTQLMAFVMGESAFRRRMMNEIDPDHWIAPSLSLPKGYLEPLQGGALKHLGIMKPWAPSQSYGLIVRLNDRFQPVDSLHSRADGKRHGITSCLEHNGSLLATSKGGNVILAMAQGPGEKDHQL